MENRGVKSICMMTMDADECRSKTIENIRIYRTGCMFGYNRRRCPKVAFCSLLRAVAWNSLPD